MARSPAGGNGKKFLTRDELMTARPPKIIEVELPDGAGVVRLRALRAAEREELDSLANKDGKSDYRLYRARAVALALIGEDNEPFFQNPMREAVQLSEKLSSMELDVCFQGVDSISALTKRTQDAVGKGSVTTTSTDS